MSVALKKDLDRLSALHRRIADDIASETEKSEALKLIDELVAKKYRPAVIHLLSFLVLEDSAIAIAAGQAVKQLIHNLKAVELLLMDESVRGSQYHSHNYRASWDKVNKDSIVHLLNRVPEPTLLLGLGSMHRNGFIRQFCLNELDKSRDGSELPFILIRTTDWVPEISTLAKSMVQARLKKENGALFVQNIATIERLKQRKRGDAARVLKLSHEQAIQSPLSDFIAQLSSDDLQARRLCMYQGLARPDRIQIIEAGTENSDQQVRQIAYMAGIPQFAPERKLEVIKKGLQDPYPSNRREILRAAVLHFPEQQDELVFPLLLDRSSKVRLLAKYLWKEKHNDFDFDKYYRERISVASGAELIAAMRGLSDSRLKEDYPLLEKYLSDKNIQIRKAAIDCMVLIDREKSLQMLLKLLAQEEAGTLSAIKKNLLLCDRFLSGEDLWRVFSACKQMSTRLCILKILATLPKWEQLGYFLIAYANKNEEVSKLALGYLKRWQDRFRQSWVFTQPNQAQAERIRLAASLVGAKLDIPKYRELQLVFESVKVTVID